MTADSLPDRSKMVILSRRQRWTRASFAIVVIVAFVAAACTPPPPPPPKTNACSVDATTLSTLSVAEAEAQAVEAVGEAEADPALRDADGKVPLVVTSDAADGSPEFHVVAVDDAENARAVGQFTAATGEVLAIEVDRPVHALETFPPNDPRFPEQWGMQSNKTTFGAGWSQATGADVVVAVLDTGVQADHPDLANKIVLPGLNFRQDDHSSLVDPNGHGTHVAGIVGAEANNGEGIVGAAPGVGIRSVKVLDSNGNGFVSTVAAGINEVVNGDWADVINISLGTSTKNDTLKAAVQHAWANKVLMVAAAGNSGETTTAGFEPGVHCVWPAGHWETLTVGSVDSNLLRSSFSNRGTFLDVVAPGRTILSASSSYPNPQYKALTGTSMAAPFGAAAFAMLLEKCPAKSYNWYLIRIRDTAFDLGPAGFDISYGYGIVNPHAALQAGC